MFKAMFTEGKFAEATSGRVQVENLRLENLEKLINYIYTDQVQLLSVVYFDQ